MNLRKTVHGREPGKGGYPDPTRRKRGDSEVSQEREELPKSMEPAGARPVSSGNAGKAKGWYQGDV